MNPKNGWNQLKLIEIVGIQKDRAKLNYSDKKKSLAKDRNT